MVRFGINTMMIFIVYALTLIGTAGLCLWMGIKTTDKLDIVAVLLGVFGFVYTITDAIRKDSEEPVIDQPVEDN